MFCFYFTYGGVSIEKSPLKGAVNGMHISNRNTERQCAAKNFLNIFPAHPQKNSYIRSSSY